MQQMILVSKEGGVDKAEALEENERFKRLIDFDKEGELERLGIEGKFGECGVNLGADGEEASLDADNDYVNVRQPQREVV
jgi:hypothetical protein|tara:strand:- start:331 stop:570 length:240 start_codon:yes stop_codon:yes gene_type:complete